MNILLDTHIALWAITDSPRLPIKVRETIQQPKVNIWVSVVSLWEITIKHGLARGDMPISGDAALRYFQQSGYQILSIEAEHVLAVATLESHHQDPFDRLLVAQAMTEPMHLITHDKIVAQYSPSIMLV